MFQTIIDGTVKAPIQFSMDDGFLGIRKPSTPSLKRARSGSSVPDNASLTMMTLREASRHMHERKRTSVSVRQEQHNVDIHELREPDGLSVDKDPRSLTLSSKSTTHSPSSSHKERTLLSASRRVVVGISRQQCCLLFRYLPKSESVSVLLSISTDTLFDISADQSNEPSAVADDRRDKAYARCQTQWKSHAVVCSMSVVLQFPFRLSRCHG